MRLGIRQKAKLFDYIKELDWQKELKTGSWGFGGYECETYVAVSSENRLAFELSSFESWGLMGKEKDFVLEISRPGEITVQKVKGAFAKKVFKWVKENTFTVEDEIKRIQSEIWNENEKELESVIKEVIK